MSLPYSVAVALVDGQALFPQYNNARLKEPEIVRLTQMVAIEPDPSLPRGVSCKMTITMEDGNVYTSQVDYPKGSIQNPMSDDELRGKFDLLARPVIGQSQADQLADGLWDIEKCSDLTALMSLSQP